MSSLESLSLEKLSLEKLKSLEWRDLQRLAKKNGVTANMTSDMIIDQLIEIKARLIEEEEKKDDGVKWFKQAGNNFEIGVELYKGGFPLVKGDNRTYMKVHMRGMPIKFKGSIVGDACQLFYLSSGKNSNLDGVWLPTNVISLLLNYNYPKSKVKSKVKPAPGFSVKTTPVVHWVAQKRPWYIGGESNASTRFGGDPSVAMISQILGCLRKDDCDIEKIEAYVTKNLKSHLKTVFGEKIAEKKWKEMNDYCEKMSDEINEYLRDKWENVERPKCDNYDINIWIKKCNSYNWFAPFDPDEPDYIPILDPLDISKDSLWEEGGKEGNTGLILRSNWLNGPASTMRYRRLVADLKNNEIKEGRKRLMEKQLEQQKIRRNANSDKIIAKLLSREELKKRLQKSKYSPVQSSSRQSSSRQSSSSSFSPTKAELKKLRKLEYRIKNLTGNFPLSTQSCENCEKEVEIHQRVRMAAAKMGLKGGGLKPERLQYMKDLCIDCAERECNLYKRLTKLGIKAINKEECFAKLRRAEMVKKW